MTLMQHTSLSAYKDLIRGCKIQPEELKVIDTLSEHGSKTDLELSEIIGMSINSITGRRNSLFKKEIVVKRGKKRNERTGKLAIIWGLWNKLL